MTYFHSEDFTVKYNEVHHKAWISGFYFYFYFYFCTSVTRGDIAFVATGNSLALYLLIFSLLDGKPTAWVGSNFVSDKQ